jgi:pilus assembly protein CpaB
MLRVAAIAVAVIAAFMGVMYLRFSGDDTRTVPDNDTVPVVVAAGDIAAGTRISEGMVKVIDVPEGLVLAGAYDDSPPVVGQVTKVSLLEGEQVIASKLNQGDVECFGCVMPPGKRAVSLNVEPTGNWRPGDWVDILAIDDNAGTAPTIVQTVEILAVGADTLGSVTVTVALDAAQAAIVAEAQERASRITLAMRGGDQ